MPDHSCHRPVQGQPTPAVAVPDRPGGPGLVWAGPPHPAAACRRPPAQTPPAQTAARRAQGPVVGAGGGPVVAGSPPADRECDLRLPAVRGPDGAVLPADAVLRAAG